MIVLLCTFITGVFPFVEEYEAVTLQLQVQVEENGAPILGIKDLTVKLSHSTEVGLIAIWEQDYQYEITDGSISIALNGADKSGEQLVAEMFDSGSVTLTIQIDGEEMVIDLISQPFAIKARISDETTSTQKLQGVQLTDQVPVENDMLIIEGNEWVLKNKDDVLDLIEIIEEEKISINSLEDIAVTANASGDLLTFAGDLWRNEASAGLTTAGVEEVLTSYNYKLTVGIADLVTGNYDQITGIGNQIEIASMININNNVAITGDLKVTVDLGSKWFPIEKIVVNEINIGNGTDEATLTNTNNQLLINKGLVIETQDGEGISAVGSANRAMVFSNESEGTAISSINWSRDRNQLAIGGDLSDEAVSLNVSGIMRVAGDVIIGQDKLSVEKYILKETVSTVGFSGEFSDLLDQPDSSDFIEISSFYTTLEQHSSMNHFVSELSSKITTFETETLISEVETALSDYETSIERDDKLAIYMEDYFDKEGAQIYLDSDEFAGIIVNYSTESEINALLENEYVTTSAVSAIGYSGSYHDLLNTPNVVMMTDYGAYTADIKVNYPTKVFAIDEIQTATENLYTEIMAEVAAVYVTKQNITDAGYASQDSLDALKRVAQTGEYEDIENRPDLSVYLSADEISENYIDNSELAAGVDPLIEIAEVETVGFTGSYGDLSNAPNFDDYVLVETLDEYVSKVELENQMIGVIRTDS